MEKRDFIKCGFCALSSLMLSACSHNEVPVKNDKKYPILHIEVPICYHCNLNCAYCDHFSPIAPIYEMPVEVFKKDMKRLAKITDSYLKEMYILGGEPLLHKDIEKIIKIARENFPDTQIRVYTNGLLLNHMKESFWKTCGHYNVNILYTPYMLAKNFPKNFDTANEYSRKYDVNIATARQIYEFNLTQLSTKPIFDKKSTYDNCADKARCVTLDNGKLYMCAVQDSLKFLNNYFKDKQIPVPEEDVLDIYKINSSKEIWDYLRKPKEVCAHCGYYVHLKPKKWKVSEKQASEWYIDG